MTYIPCKNFKCDSCLYCGITHKQNTCEEYQPYENNNINNYLIIDNISRKVMGSMKMPVSNVKDFEKRFDVTLKSIVKARKTEGGD